MVTSCRVPANFVQKRYSLICITISITGMPGVVIGGGKGKIWPDAFLTNLLVLKMQRPFDKWLLMLNSLELSTKIVRLILTLTK